MHGVGHQLFQKAVAAFGLPPYIETKQQIHPDPEFPTVEFPNPEEGKGALKLAIETATANNSPLIIANDPDADRLAVAEITPSGQWKIFTGNEIGILLASWSWSQYKKKNTNVDSGKCVVLNTAVSSKMLQAFAKKEGLYYEETLTGFKWMGNVADGLIKKGNHFIFAFEEAIGFMISEICLDKDGVRGGCVFAEFASSLYDSGHTCQSFLDSLYATYGFYTTKNHYFFCYDPETLKKIFTRLRNFDSAKSPSYPKSCGPYPIKHIRDLTIGYDDNQPNNKPILPVSTSTEMITFFFENGCVATLRGSGTEPKLKYYVEMNGDHGNQDKVRETLLDVVKHIIIEFLQPEQNGLEPPRD
eukprot:TRINITY_DN1431_c0_g1_i1.p1 TRINITY_DN1431_c0_g1~~TRINITY_DN1431_c0_g1_i1.p1  ORF type:complete len:358 (-),score=115.55 TRINITY_DN1431_c0_g1_i1:118-1191(-)